MNYLIPGMGADSKMYAGPWRHLKKCCFVDWPPWDGERTIADVAGTMVRRYRINEGDTVIGTSLGGMVCLEIATIVKVRKIILISSAFNAGELSRFAKLLMPLAFRSVVEISQFLASFFGNYLFQMYSRSEPEFVVAMSKAILHWRGFHGDVTKVARIHGRRDILISCPENSEIIEDGTHAQECVIL